MRGWEQDGSSETPADAAGRCDRTSVTASELREQSYAPRSQACVLSSGRRGRRFGSGHPDQLTGHLHEVQMAFAAVSNQVSNYASPGTCGKIRSMASAPWTMTGRICIR